MADGKMGFHHYSRTSATLMAELISADMHAKLIQFIKSDGFGPCSIIVDGSTDPRQNHYLIVYLQSLEQLRPIVYFYGLLEIGLDETADGFLNILKKAFEKDGITESMKRTLIAFASDGASVMLGKHAGLGKKLSEFVQRPLIEVHCMAHRIHLAIRRAFRRNKALKMFAFESFLNKLYSFYYSHGHK
jgi:hypothetical protein